LVVAPCASTEALLETPALEHAGLAVERAADSDAAIARVEQGDGPDVVLLAPRLADPVRVAQRLHSLDRKGAVVVLADEDGANDLRHALAVAPFLSGDVAMVGPGETDSLVDVLAAAAARTRERREAAADLKNRRDTPPPLSASYLGTLLDNVPIGLVTLDAEAAVIGWNKRAGEMLETPEVEALGTSFTQLFEPDVARLEALIEGLGSGLDEGGEVFERDGRWFEITGARFAIRSGETGSLLILQDVTKRHAAEREVELQRALMAAQADSSMVAIAVVTLDGSLQRMNSRWTEMWGVDADLVRNDRDRATKLMLDQVVDPEAFMIGIERLAATEDGDYQDEVALKDGRVIERYATHVRSESGEVVGRIWFHTDITEHRREEDALRFLADATNLLSSSLDYETTLQRVADLTVPRMATWCSVEIAEEVGHRAVAIAHADPERVQWVKRVRSDYPEAQTGAVAQVIASGAPIVFRELNDDDVIALARDERHLEILRELELRSVMIVPIKVRDRIFGAINFIRSRREPPYDDDDLQLALELARRAAIAIDNSRVHAELRHTARTLQESLLPPHLPSAHGLELAARFRPAGAGLQVGGDFYDIFETAPDQWAIAVGDVCGKGAEAAALTALTRYTVRAAAMYEKAPSGVLRVLNEALLRQRSDYRFTTLAICLLDLSGDQPSVRVACGGHPRPMLLRPDGAAQVVGAMGPLLGVVAEAKFEDEHVELEQDDVIVLYTDGLTDALAPRQMLDENDLLAALSDCRGKSAGEIAQCLEARALSADATVVPRDDIALVVAKLG
jgi:PAS domain S-box-containing protein